MFGSGPVDDLRRLRASKLYKAGFRSNNIDPNARHCMASAVGRIHPAFGADEPMGCYDDLARRRVRAVGFEHGRDAPGAVVAPDRYAPDQAGL